MYNCMRYLDTDYTTAYRMSLNEYNVRISIYNEKEDEEYKQQLNLAWVANRMIPSVTEKHEYVIKSVKELYPKDVEEKEEVFDELHQRVARLKRYQAKRGGN